MTIKEFEKLKELQTLKETNDSSKYQGSKSKSRGLFNDILHQGITGYKNKLNMSKSSSKEVKQSMKKNLVELYEPKQNLMGSI